MVTDIILAIITVILALSMAQREGIARRQERASTAQTDAMDDLTRALNAMIDEIRSVQTYGLRLQK